MEDASNESSELTTKTGIPDDAQQLIEIIPEELISAKWSILSVFNKDTCHKVNGCVEEL